MENLKITGKIVDWSSLLTWIILFIPFLEILYGLTTLIFVYLLDLPKLIIYEKTLDFPLFFFIYDIHISYYNLVIYVLLTFLFMKDSYTSYITENTVEKKYLLFIEKAI